VALGREESRRLVWLFPWIIMTLQYISPEVIWGLYKKCCISITVDGCNDRVVTGELSGWQWQQMWGDKWDGHSAMKVVLNIRIVLYWVHIVVWELACRPSFSSQWQTLHSPLVMSIIFWWCSVMMVRTLNSTYWQQQSMVCLMWSSFNPLAQELNACGDCRRPELKWQLHKDGHLMQSR